MSRPVEAAPTAPSPEPSRHRPARTAWRLPAGWPLAAAVAGFPVWWALGLSAVAVPLAAVPLAWQLARRGGVRLPPGFWLWLLFLAWVVASAFTLDLTAPGTLPPSGSGRYAAYALRLVNYLAVTVFVLYVGNMPERALPRLRVVRWVAGLCVGIVALGWAAVLLPGLEFDTLAGVLLPSQLADAGRGTVQLAQVQPVLGDPAPRPAAPFAFTNAWGHAFILTAVWLVVGWALTGSRTRRTLGVLVLLASVVPVVYSLNRGVWIAAGLAAVYVAVRLAARGRLLTLGVVAVGLAVAAMVFAATPLSGLVTQRVDAGHSNEVRTSLAADALGAARSSPVLGYGSTREAIGSASSIAVGQTEDCPRCGNRNIGSTGHVWLLLIAQGFVGAALYLSYFVYTAWHYRRDHSVIGIAGTLVVLLSLFLAFFYTSLTMPLAIVFISIGLLWRNAAVRAGEDATPDSAAPASGPDGGPAWTRTR